ncbi:MAG TPA: lamin tail domain-containing protein, partial [Puia sp.]|nr:lamin tail domain-containing protein [Puia sp.]
RYDVVIDEILADPSPVVGLPNAEFIELRNKSGSSYNLRYWKISNGITSATLKEDFILEPDSFLILCAKSAADDYQRFGTTMGITGFPSLNNDKGTISLFSAEGMTIHSVSYNPGWFQNAFKSDGGWSIEMIDPRNACGGSLNWIASRDPVGGTPGKLNSVDGKNPDFRPPHLLRTYTLDNTNLVAVFDEPLDSALASSNLLYEIEPAIGFPDSALPIPPAFVETRLHLTHAMQTNIIYRLKCHDLADCTGNSMGTIAETRTGMPSLPETSDLIINEILFNPPSNGYDYLEIYNKSDKIVDLNKMFVANKTASGSLNDWIRLATIPLLCFPGDYFAFTENANWTQVNFSVKNPEMLVELSSLPSMPDDHGYLMLMDHQGKGIDSLEYDHSWQFALLDKEDGVALERINYNKPTQDQSNWASAASTAGFGTPTAQNSQFNPGQLIAGSLSILPKIFSPDNDGFEDYCIINYKLPEPGYVANIILFDLAGRPVRYLTQNAILGMEGSFRWDGLDDRK